MYRAGNACHPDLDPDPIDQPLQVLLEQVLAGAIAPATVAQQQYRGRSGVERPAPDLPPPLDAVAGELAGVVAGAQVHVTVVWRFTSYSPCGMITPEACWGSRDRTSRSSPECRDGPLDRSCPPTPSSSGRCSESGSSPHVLPLEPGDILELLVAVDMLPHREGLAGLALDVVVLAEQLLDHGDTDRCARLG